MVHPSILVITRKYVDSSGHSMDSIWLVVVMITSWQYGHYHNRNRWFHSIVIKQLSKHCVGHHINTIYQSVEVEQLIVVLSSGMSLHSSNWIPQKQEVRSVTLCFPIPLMNSSPLMAIVSTKSQSGITPICRKWLLSLAIP